MNQLVEMPFEELQKKKPAYFEFKFPKWFSSNSKLMIKTFAEVMTEMNL